MASQDMLKAAERFALRSKHLLAKRQMLQDEMLETWWESPRAVWGAVWRSQMVGPNMEMDGDGIR